MQRLDAILVCGRCESIFVGRDMLVPCPECGGSFCLGMTEDGLLNALVDAEELERTMRAKKVGKQP